MFAHIAVSRAECQGETIEAIVQSTTVEVFVQNIFANLGQKRKFPHHNWLFESFGGAAACSHGSDDCNRVWEKHHA